MMGFQQVVCVLTVTIALFCLGCHTLQPACVRAANNIWINGSENTAQGRWPWLVDITFDDFYKLEGSLINDQWVLTSDLYKYVLPNPKKVVNLGVYNPSQNNPGPVSRTVAKEICLPRSDNLFSNSICLLKLSAPVNFTDYIQPVCLSSLNSTFYEGVTSWSIGFDGYYGKVNPNEVSVPIAGTNKCNCSIQDSLNFEGIDASSIVEDWMCVEFNDKQANQLWRSVSGLLLSKTDSVWVLTGFFHDLTSYGYHASYMVFIKVSQFEEWIRETVTGTDTGFVTFISPGIDNDLDYTCPTQPPSTTTSHATTTTTYAPLTTGYAPPTTSYAPPTTRDASTITSYTPTTTGYAPPTTRDAPPTTHYVPPATHYPQNTTLAYTFPIVVSTTDKDNSIFSGGENLTHFAYFITIFALALTLHVSVGSG